MSSCPIWLPCKPEGLVEISVDLDGIEKFG